MKATGIVRRIDDLGRVVIPKEIRRTLRIRDGDALEIYTDNMGGVIFKKYSPVGELSATAAQVADVLQGTAGRPVLVCDRDHVVAVSGVSKREYLERRVSAELEEAMQGREAAAGDEVLHPVEGVACTACAVCPILVQGDVTGAVVLLQQEGKTAGEGELQLVRTAAGFLGRQLEA